MLWSWPKCPEGLFCPAKVLDESNQKTPDSRVSFSGKRGNTSDLEEEFLLQRSNSPKTKRGFWDTYLLTGR